MGIMIGVVGIAGFKAKNAITPKADRELIDEFAHGLRLVRRALKAVAIKMGLCGAKRFGHWNRETDAIETKPWVKRIGQRCKALTI